MSGSDQRVAWVDCATALCVIMIVMVHSTLSVESAAGAEGWMRYILLFVTPFAIPSFFMISGLLLAHVIDRDWRTYLDEKVVHFAYFYMLWLIIEFAAETPGLIDAIGFEGAARQFPVAVMDPPGTLWLVGLLPIFFIVGKATRYVPWSIVWLIGVGLETARIDTGWILVDEFASRFVYFYSGYVFAAHILRLADRAVALSSTTGVGLIVWGLTNGLAVFGGISEWPVIRLVLGLVGAVAVASFANLLARSPRMASRLAHCGRNWLVICLVFSLSAAVAGLFVVILSAVIDVGTISLVVTVAGVVGPLVMCGVVHNSPARFFFERPSWARLRPRPPHLVLAE